MIEIRQTRTIFRAICFLVFLGTRVASSAADMPNTVGACPRSPSEWVDERTGDLASIQTQKE
jgi:hypothetical protein